MENWRIGESGRSEAGSRYQIETVKGEIQVGKAKRFLDAQTSRLAPMN